MSYTPAADKKEYERRMDAIKVCGANRGPHTYQQVAWHMSENSKQVVMMMCTTCFTRVAMKTLYDHFPEAKM
jgi:hypothetical protein